MQQLNKKTTVTVWSATLGLVTAGAVATVLLLIFARSTGLNSLSERVLVITAADASVGDDFGRSIAMTGQLLLVGAPFDDDHGFGSGSVYGFDAATGEQRFKLAATDAAADHWFGWSVALSGNTALVGARNDSHSAPAAGSAYLFDVSTGKQLRKLVASDASPNANFGRAVAMDRHRALVGAMTAAVRRNDVAGAAYVFDVDTGTQLFKLTAPNETDVFFGSSVAVCENTALIAAKSSSRSQAPSATVYVFDLTTGKAVGELTAPAPRVLGVPVALDRGKALVGAPHGGRACLFHLPRAESLFQLSASDEFNSDGFGASVAIGGNTVVVGAVQDDQYGCNSGVAYVFNASSGRQIAKLAAPDAAAGDYFGLSVAVHGNSILVAAPFKHDGGSVYLFRQAAVPASSATRRAPLAVNPIVK